MPGKRLLVDACVGRSSGEKSEAPQSRYSREALTAIRDYPGHLITMNTKLRKEWIENASSFGRSFLTYMFQRRRVFYVPDNAFVGVMRGYADQFKVPSVKASFEKDTHVISGALGGDKIIISTEVRLQEQLAKLAVNSDLLALIVWVNPGSEGAACVEWIKNGALSEEHRQIAVVIPR